MSIDVPKDHAQNDLRTVLSIVNMCLILMATQITSCILSISPYTKGVFRQMLSLYHCLFCTTIWHKSYDCSHEQGLEKSIENDK